MLQGDWCDTVLQLKYSKYGFLGCSVLIAYHLVPQSVRVAAKVFKACIPGQCSVMVAHHLLVLRSLRPIRGQRELLQCEVMLSARHTAITFLEFQCHLSITMGTVFSCSAIYT